MNLLLRPRQSKYDKTLFESRKQISASGFFEPLIERICEMIANGPQSTRETTAILDAGCGEGPILSQFSQPSGMKLFKLHIPESMMQLGMSMYQTMMAIFMILGPMLGTLVYFRFGIHTAVAIMGICFLLSAAVLTWLPPDRKVEGASTTNLSQEMKMGLHYVISNKIFVYMGGFFLAAGMGIGLVNPLGIYLVTEHLGLTAQSLQWFTAVHGVGMVLGGFISMGLSKPCRIAAGNP
ncbi:MFS transporter [Paenibacillus thermoaerophilus]|uniref:MFS transporter n=1 Tax=Paenibacillus thermoaerophilus TaxID=1215385 RepID=A0ABW2V8R4_9BACL|nr:MFS transporter [Paenibacillus thermoaerophilus]